VKKNRVLKKIKAVPNFAVRIRFYFFEEEGALCLLLEWLWEDNVFVTKERRAAAEPKKKKKKKKEEYDPSQKPLRADARRRGRAIQKGYGIWRIRSWQAIFCSFFPFLFL
jgi:hypothetical protein